jgi:CDP-glucose 4,6-dehydratase
MFSWKNKNVFITGAGGFIGFHLSEKLANEGACVTALCRSNDKIKKYIDNFNQIKFELVEGLVENFDTISKIINTKKIDTVFHLAANNSNIGAVLSPLTIFESNIKGSWSVLEACRLGKNIERVLVASSREAELQESIKFDKANSKISHLWKPYQVSKISVEFIVRAYADTYNLPVVITRSDNIYGGGDLNWNRLIPGVIKSILDNQLPELRSNGNLARDYLYIDDIINGYEKLAAYSNFHSLKGNIFHFTSGESITALEIVRIIYEILNREYKNPIIKNTINSERIDKPVKKINNIGALDWKSKTDIKNGLRKTIIWYLDYFNKNKFSIN